MPLSYVGPSRGYSATVFPSISHTIFCLNSHSSLRSLVIFLLNIILSKHSLAGSKINISSLIPVLKRSPQLQLLRYVKCQCAQCTSSVATCTFMCTTLCMAGVAPHTLLRIGKYGSTSYIGMHRKKNGGQ